MCGVVQLCGCGGKRYVAYKNVNVLHFQSKCVLIYHRQSYIAVGDLFLLFNFLVCFICTGCFICVCILGLKCAHPGPLVLILKMRFDPRVRPLQSVSAQSFKFARSALASHFFSSLRVRVLVPVCNASSHNLFSTLPLASSNAGLTGNRIASLHCPKLLK